MLWKGIATRKHFDSYYLPWADLTRYDQDPSDKASSNVSNPLRHIAIRIFYGVQIQNEAATTVLRKFLKPLEGLENFSSPGFGIRRERIQDLQDKGRFFNS